MSPRTPPILSGQQVAAALARTGFVSVSQRGSHQKLRHPDGRTAIVPLHRELAPGTLRSILRPSHLTLQELQPFLRTDEPSAPKHSSDGKHGFWSAN
jgi:predicted RNA binding protein YcfA (HicA-like mRNA interferase family)